MKTGRFTIAGLICNSIKLLGLTIIKVVFILKLRLKPLNYKNLEQRIYSELSLLRQLEDGIESTLNDL